VSKTLITFPGKLGDCIWAAATMKEFAGAGQIDIALSVFCRPLVDILWCQSWVQDVMVLEDWHIFPGSPAPIQPVVPPTVPTGYDRVVHLGLPDWPQMPLGAEFGRITHLQSSGDPWLRPPSAIGGEYPRVQPAIAFTDEHVELKVGVICALADNPHWQPTLLCSPGSRISSEFAFHSSLHKVILNVKRLANWIGACQFLITDKSLPRVLAYAMGIPTYVVEPAEARWNNIFDPPRDWRRDNGLLNGGDARQVLQMVGGV